MEQKKPHVIHYAKLLSYLPTAAAPINGSAQYPKISGMVRFYETRGGVVVAAEITGLPNPDDICKSPIFGFHIHDGGMCQGNAEDPFADAGTHYNPHSCPHPYHAGDLPPLFGADGNAFSAFLTDRFTVREILGKTVILHANPDDFTTQPSGNSGTKIACGIISAVRR